MNNSIIPKAIVLALIALILMFAVNAGLDAIHGAQDRVQQYQTYHTGGM